MKKGVDNTALELEENEKDGATVAVLNGDEHIQMANPESQDEEPEKTSCFSIGNLLEKFWSSISHFIEEHSLVVRFVVYIVIALLYNAYFIASILYAHANSIPIDWCDGVGFLIIITAVVYAGLFYFQVVKRFWGNPIYKRVLKPLYRILGRIWQFRIAKIFTYLALVAALVVFLVIDTADERQRLISFFGLLVFIVLGWLFSLHPARVIWRHVIWGVALQFVFGLIVLRWDTGRLVFQCLGDKVTVFLDYTNAGSGFVYGYLVTDQNASGVALGTVFAFRVLSVIFFFSFCISILYYYGTMQWIVRKLGWLLQISVGTTAAESMNAAGNIFLGQTEAPLLIRPFIDRMTKSELHAVMTGGFATIAGSVLAAYISFGISASHLISASVMSAPAALAIAKLLLPEAEKSQTKAKDIRLPQGTESNALDAAAQGASNAVFLVYNIVANLIAFLAFIAFLNGIISWLGSLLGASFLTFEYIVGKIFIPVAWLMGVPAAECDLVANLVALKTIVNEFAAYSKLSEYMAQGLISKRSEIVATYALCGFSNPGSIGTQVAALATMAPQRKSDLAQVAFRAFVAGSIACFMTACIAGTLISSVEETAAIAEFPASALSFMPNITALSSRR